MWSFYHKRCTCEAFLQCVFVGDKPPCSSGRRFYRTGRRRKASCREWTDGFSCCREKPSWDTIRTGCVRKLKLNKTMKQIFVMRSLTATYGSAWRRDASHTFASWIFSGTNRTDIAARFGVSRCVDLCTLGWSQPFRTHHKCIAACRDEFLNGSWGSSAGEIFDSRKSTEMFSQVWACERLSDDIAGSAWTRRYCRIANIQIEASATCVACL